MITVKIEKPPADYSGWIECLKRLQKGVPDTDTFMTLREGRCPGYAAVKQSLHKLVEDTVNAIIDNCIKALRREITKHAEAKEIEGIHTAFIRFAKRINGCMFFTEMVFLDTDFSGELRRNAVRQIALFWDEMKNNIKKEAAAHDDQRMADELFLINRIELLEDYRIS